MNRFDLVVGVPTAGAGELRWILAALWLAAMSNGIALPLENDDGVDA